MANLNETPSSNRLHIGIFGKTNSGKSTLINAFTNQNVSIVADVAGTTTDPVYKPMEIHPLGPCVLIDTAGYDDESELGERRIEKTRLAAEKADIAVIVVAAHAFDCMDTTAKPKENESYRNQTIKEVYKSEYKWFEYFKQKKTPVLFIVNQFEDCEQNDETVMQSIKSENPHIRLADRIRKELKVDTLLLNAKTREGMPAVKDALTRLMPEDFSEEFITGDLVSEGDLVLLVMPQDIQAPKGRLILPQVQTLRELLDKKCLVMSTTTDKFKEVLLMLNHSPKLIITDSQVFGYVAKNKPKESMLTSFSVLFAAYKGDLPYYLEGAKAIDTLTPQSKVLIAECCTHAPLAEDIGRVKIPAMLRRRFGETLSVSVVSGTDFPDDLSGYDLIIQCGACMFNRKYVLSRINRARVQNIPMTNYGVTIAHLTGILDQVTMP